jgi:hypothetical protein
LSSLGNWINREQWIDEARVHYRISIVVRAGASRDGATKV